MADVVSSNDFVCLCIGTIFSSSPFRGAERSSIDPSGFSDDSSTPDITTPLFKAFGAWLKSLSFKVRTNWKMYDY